jgi:hypothetical protein
VGGLFPGFWLVLPSSLQVLERVLAAGGAVVFHFFALLLPSNDDIAGARPALMMARRSTVEKSWRLQLPYWMSSASSTLMLDEDSLSILHPHLHRVDQGGSCRSHLARPALGLHSPRQRES